MHYQKPMGMSLLELDWRQIVVESMAPLRIAKHLDAVKDILPRGIPCRVGLAFEPFTL